MHGLGKYAWADGKEFRGQYVDDKKTGYGIYKWPDGRQYKGYWLNGKQHGFAEYCSEAMTPRNHLETASRYGLWEGGRRLKWFAINKDEDLDAQKQKYEEEMLQDQRKSFSELTASTNSGSILSTSKTYCYKFNPPHNFTETFVNKQAIALDVKSRLDQMQEKGINKLELKQTQAYTPSNNDASPFSAM